MGSNSRRIFNRSGIGENGEIGFIINKIAKQIIDCFVRGNKVLIFGNGGSLADASHFAAEFHGLGPVIALNDLAKITSIANDGDFDYIFAQQVYDLGKKGDIIVGLSSSGNSKNVNIALFLAEDLGFEIIDFPRLGANTQEVQNFQYQLLHDIYLKVKKLTSA